MAEMLAIFQEQIWQKAGLPAELTKLGVVKEVRGTHLPRLHSRGLQTAIKEGSKEEAIRPRP